MENKNFIIENGVLTKYKGPSGDVTIPEGVTKIGGRVFYRRIRMKNVIIPEGVTTIGTEAFRNCTSLKSVTIPASVTEISEDTFYGCTSLQSVTILARVTKIEKSVFEGSRPILIAPCIPISGFCVQACCGFAKLLEAGTETDGEIKAGYLKYIRGQKKRLYPLAVQHEELLRLMMSEKMLAREDVDLLLEECNKRGSIMDKAALMEYANKNLKLLDPVKEMEREFAAQEEFLSTGVMKVGEAKKIFRYRKLETGRLRITAYKGTALNILLPKAIGKDTVVEIDKYAFSGCTSLQSVTIPESVTVIGKSAFRGCTGLQSVTILEGVTEIDEWAFEDCASLQSATIQASVRKIRLGVFTNCKNLTIHAPAGSDAERYAKEYDVPFEVL